MEEQCKGITKSGNRCKIRVNLINGYCRIHQDQAASAHAQSPEAEQKETAVAASHKQQAYQAPETARPEKEPGAPPVEPRAQTEVYEYSETLTGFAKLAISIAALLTVIFIIVRRK